MTHIKILALGLLVLSSASCAAGTCARGRCPAQPDFGSVVDSTAAGSDAASESIAQR